MATWTTIPDSSLEPGKPIRSIDTLALRDNPVAIAEGAAGAPRVLSFAFEPLDAGDVIRSRYDSQDQSDTTVYALVADWAFMQYGSVRISCELRNTSGSTASNCQVRRVRNNVSTTLTTLSNNTASFVQRTVDVSVVMGDKIELWFAQGSFSGASVYISNKRLQTSGAKWWPATSGAVE
jgi:hypothetical protein